MADPKVSAAAQKTLGLPVGFKTFSPAPFAGMNQEASGPFMQDSEFAWIENFAKIGDGNLRALWDVGTPIYFAPAGKTIVSHFFYTIADTYYAAVFLSDGSAVQVNVATQVTTPIGTGFYVAATGFLPACTQWGIQYLLISNRNDTDNYWAWDGSLLYEAGTAAPNGVVITSGGANYTSVPTVFTYGGAGGGMEFLVTVQGGSVVNVEITNPGSGYNPGDVVQLAFDGGGSDNSAVLEASLTPGGVGGLNITDAGSGYSTANISFSGGGGTGAAATAIISSTTIIGATITNPGSGYISAPSVTITGDGSAATASAVLAPEGVATVSVIEGGSGFTSVPLISFVGGGGAGATGVVLLTPTSIAGINVTASGSGYTSAPTISFESSTGSGAAATAIIAGDGVAQVVVTNAGSGYTTPVTVLFAGGGTDAAGAAAEVVFAPTSIDSVLVSSGGQFYTTAPAVEVSTSSNNSAYATVSLMPYGVSGSSIETFQQRVWIADPAALPYGDLPPGGNWQVSAPESFTDFATSDGGVLFTNSDSFLQTRYVAIRQSNGYLYFFGDGSISVVSNVQTSGTPATTTFNYQNVDPQIGASWRDSRQDFGRSIIIANESGVYGLYGGSATKVSQKLDKLFNTALFPPTADAITPATVLTPSGAIATIYDVKHYLNLMTVVDPITKATRVVMIAWNEKEWTIASQSVNLIYIGTQKVESKFTAWGTDGNALYPLFATPSSTLQKRLNSKDYGSDRPFLIKDFLSFYLQAQDQSTAQTGVAFSTSFSISGLAAQPVNPNLGSVPSGVFPNLSFQSPTFSAPPPAWPTWGGGAGGAPFVNIAIQIESTSPDFVLSNIVIGYVDIAAIF